MSILALFWPAKDPPYLMAGPTALSQFNTCTAVYSKRGSLHYHAPLHVHSHFFKALLVASSDFQAYTLETSEKLENSEGLWKFVKSGCFVKCWSIGQCVDLILFPAQNQPFSGDNSGRNLQQFWKRGQPPAELSAHYHCQRESRKTIVGSTTSKSKL